MIKRIRPQLTNALTRPKVRSGVDPKRIILAFLVLSLALLKFVHWILFPTTESPHSVLDSLDAVPNRGRTKGNSGSRKEGVLNSYIPMNAQQQQMSFKSPIDPDLPKWIRDYISWHREIRAKYPGDELFQNSKAPNVLIRTCLGLCGGLNDRLGQLPWDLYLANQTGRVLFMRWFRPKPLEDFLLPNAFNWSMPPNLENFDRLQSVKHGITEMFDGYDDARPTDEFWKSHLDEAIHRAKHGKFKNVKILRHRILGHLNEHELEKRLQDLGETDMLHSTLSFGKIFWLFFRPVPAIEMELEDVYRTLNIAPLKYSAVHCRVRHPKAFAKQVGV